MVSDAKLAFWVGFYAHIGGLSVKLDSLGELEYIDVLGGWVRCLNSVFEC